MRNRLISRQEAAEILNCTQQTISNWVESGIIKGRIIDRRLMVDANTIDVLLDTAQDVERAKRCIESQRDEFNKTQRELDEQVRTVKDAMRLWVHSGVKQLNRNAIYAILASYKTLLNDVEIGIIHALMEDGGIAAVAETYNIKPARVVQILHRAIKKIHGARPYDSLIDEIAALKRLNSELRQKLEYCGQKADDIDHLTPILMKDLRDTSLSVRAINCCKTGDVENIADLVSLKREDLLRLRNFGKKSLREIEDLLDKLGLEFGMEVPTYLHSKWYLINKKS